MFGTEVIRWPMELFNKRQGNSILLFVALVDLWVGIVGEYGAFDTQVVFSTCSIGSTPKEKIQTVGIVNTRILDWPSFVIEERFYYWIQGERVLLNKIFSFSGGLIFSRSCENINRKSASCFNLQWTENLRKIISFVYNPYP